MVEMSLRTSIGTLQFRAAMGQITHLALPNESLPPIAVDPSVVYSADSADQRTIDAAVQWLDAYFTGKTELAELPLNPTGTPFMKTIWSLMRKIPYGQTTTYGELAKLAGNPGATRAVGLACHRNPISILIPCHRVVGVSGKLTGFRAGLALKRRLLDWEANHS